MFSYNDLHSQKEMYSFPRDLLKTQLRGFQFNNKCINMVKCGFRKILMPISVNQCGSSGRTRDGRLFVMNASDTLKFRKRNIFYEYNLIHKMISGIAI